MNTDELSSLLYNKELPNNLSLEFIVDKSWIMSKKCNGFGKTASFTLSYLRMLHSRMLQRNQNTFCISSEAMAKIVGAEAQAIRKAVKMFASKGFFTLERRKALSENVKTHWLYTPTKKFPSYNLNEFWRIPKRLILPIEEYGFGISSGTLMAVLLNIVTATKFPSVSISNRELALMLGIDRNMVGAKLDQFAQFGLVKQGNRKVVIQIGEVCDWLKAQQDTLVGKPKTRREVWKARMTKKASNFAKSLDTLEKVR